MIRFASSYASKTIMQTLQALAGPLKLDPTAPVLSELVITVHSASNLFHVQNEPQVVDEVAVIAPTKKKAGAGLTRRGQGNPTGGPGLQGTGSLGASGGAVTKRAGPANSSAAGAGGTTTSAPAGGANTGLTTGKTARAGTAGGAGGSGGLGGGAAGGSTTRRGQAHASAQQQPSPSAQPTQPRPNFSAKKAPHEIARPPLITSVSVNAAPFASHNNPWQPQDPISLPNSIVQPLRSSIFSKLAHEKSKQTNTATTTGVASETTPVSTPNQTSRVEIPALNIPSASAPAIGQGDDGVAAAAAMAAAAEAQAYGFYQDTLDPAWFTSPPVRNSKDPVYDFTVAIPIRHKENFANLVLSRKLQFIVNQVLGKVELLDVLREREAALAAATQEAANMAGQAASAAAIAAANAAANAASSSASTARGGGTARRGMTGASSAQPSSAGSHGSMQGSNVAGGVSQGDRPTARGGNSASAAAKEGNAVVANAVAAAAAAAAAAQALAAERPDHTQITYHRIGTAELDLSELVTGKSEVIVNNLPLQIHPVTIARATKIAKDAYRGYLESAYRKTIAAAAIASGVDISALTAAVAQGGQVNIASFMPSAGAGATGGLRCSNLTPAAVAAAAALAPFLPGGSPEEEEAAVQTALKEHLPILLFKEHPSLSVSVRLSQPLFTDAELKESLIVDLSAAGSVGLPSSFADTPSEAAVQQALEAVSSAVASATASASTVGGTGPHGGTAPSIASGSLSSNKLDRGKLQKTQKLPPNMPVGGAMHEVASLTGTLSGPLGASAGTASTSSEQTETSQKKPQGVSDQFALILPLPLNATETMNVVVPTTTLQIQTIEAPHDSEASLPSAFDSSESNVRSFTEASPFLSQGAFTSPPSTTPPNLPKPHPLPRAGKSSGQVGSPLLLTPGRGSGSRRNSVSQSQSLADLAQSFAPSRPMSPVDNSTVLETPPTTTVSVPQVQIPQAVWQHSVKIFLSGAALQRLREQALRGVKLPISVVAWRHLCSSFDPAPTALQPGPSASSTHTTAPPTTEENSAVQTALLQGDANAAAAAAASAASASVLSSILSPTAIAQQTWQPVDSLPSLPSKPGYVAAPPALHGVRVETTSPYISLIPPLPSAAVLTGATQASDSSSTKNALLSVYAFDISLIERAASHSASGSTTPVVTLSQVPSPGNSSTLAANNAEGPQASTPIITSLVLTPLDLFSSASAEVNIAPLLAPGVTECTDSISCTAVVGTVPKVAKLENSEADSSRASQPANSSQVNNEDVLGSLSDIMHQAMSSLFADTKITPSAPLPTIAQKEGVTLTTSTPPNVSTSTVPSTSVSQMTVPSFRAVGSQTMSAAGFSSQSHNPHAQKDTSSFTGSSHVSSSGSPSTSFMAPPQHPIDASSETMSTESQNRSNLTVPNLANAPVPQLKLSFSLSQPLFASSSESETSVTTAEAQSASSIGTNLPTSLALMEAKSALRRDLRELIKSTAKFLASQQVASMHLPSNQLVSKIHEKYPRLLTELQRNLEPHFLGLMECLTKPAASSIAQTLDHSDLTNQLVSFVFEAALKELKAASSDPQIASAERGFSALREWQAMSTRLAQRAGQWETFRYKSHAKMHHEERLARLTSIWSRLVKDIQKSCTIPVTEALWKVGRVALVEVELASAWLDVTTFALRVQDLDLVPESLVQALRFASIPSAVLLATPTNEGRSQSAILEMLSSGGETSYTSTLMSQRMALMRRGLVNRIRIDPAFAAAHNSTHLSTMLEVIESLPTAFAHVQAATSLLCALLNLNEGRVTKALERVGYAVTLFPNDVAVRLVEGLCHEIGEDPQNALTSYEHAQRQMDLTVANTTTKLDEKRREAKHRNSHKQAILLDEEGDGVEVNLIDEFESSVFRTLIGAAGIQDGLTFALPITLSGDVHLAVARLTAWLGFTEWALPRVAEASQVWLSTAGAALGASLSSFDDLFSDSKVVQALSESVRRPGTYLKASDSSHKLIDMRGRRVYGDEKPYLCLGGPVFELILMEFELLNARAPLAHMNVDLAMPTQSDDGALKEFDDLSIIRHQQTRLQKLQRLMHRIKMVLDEVPLQGTNTQSAKWSKRGSASPIAVEGCQVSDVVSNALVCLPLSVIATLRTRCRSIQARIALESLHLATVSAIGAAGVDANPFVRLWRGQVPTGDHDEASHVDTMRELMQVAEACLPVLADYRESLKQLFAATQTPPVIDVNVALTEAQLTALLSASNGSATSDTGALDSLSTALMWVRNISSAVVCSRQSQTIHPLALLLWGILAKQAQRYDEAEESLLASTWLPAQNSKDADAVLEEETELNASSSQASLDALHSIYEQPCYSTTAEALPIAWIHLAGLARRRAVSYQSDHMHGVMEQTEASRKADQLVQTLTKESAEYLSMAKLLIGPSSQGYDIERKFADLC